MKIYSGQCENGECGLETDLVDNRLRKLRVGDIVCLAHKDELGYFCFYGMSAIVDHRHRPELVGDAEYKKPFVMGLASVDINTDENWIVERVKKYEDVIDGEKWVDYGFNYRAN